MALASVFPWTACDSGDPSGPEVTPHLTPGDHTISLAHDGLSRSYLVHVPSLDAGPAPPVLVAFHGGGGNAEKFRTIASFDAHADAHGYVVVYPNGTGSAGSLTWNAGGCCGSALDAGVDDVGFSRAVIADLASRLPIDKARIYATGHSNGSMMAHRLGAEASDLVAAIAPYAGSPYLELLGFAPTYSVPVLHIHSVDDPLALYHGGVSGNGSYKTPVLTQLEAWASRNGCATPPLVGTTTYGEPGTISEGHSATLVSWRPCSSSAEVDLLRLTGPGHGWPGRILTPALQALLGPPTAIIDIEEEIWGFVSRCSR